MSGKHAPLQERHEAKVDRTPGQGPHGDCHLWTACRDPNGYGRIGAGGRGGKMLLAHRAAWELESGPIPDGLHCCHHCDNPPCVNVNHLFLGTDADNMADKEAKGRGNQAKGSAHVRAKLTEEDIPGIRSLLAMGASHTYLARIYGVGHTTIGSINTGKAWSHV